MTGASSATAAAAVAVAIASSGEGEHGVTVGSLLCRCTRLHCPFPCILTVSLVASRQSPVSVTGSSFEFKFLETYLKNNLKNSKRTDASHAHLCDRARKVSFHNVLCLLQNAPSLLFAVRYSLRQIKRTNAYRLSTPWTKRIHVQLIGRLIV